ncbi:MAG: hypothetical protein GY940_04810 [bacterium]|nr:hypothetical protein [bacterium]
MKISIKKFTVLYFILMLVSSFLPARENSRLVLGGPSDCRKEPFYSQAQASYCADRLQFLTDYRNRLIELDQPDNVDWRFNEVLRKAGVYSGYIKELDNMINSFKCEKAPTPIPCITAPGKITDDRTTLVVHQTMAWRNRALFNVAAIDRIIMENIPTNTFFEPNKISATLSGQQELFWWTTTERNPGAVLDTTNSPFSFPTPQPLIDFQGNTITIVGGNFEASLKKSLRKVIGNHAEKQETKELTIKLPMDAIYTQHGGVTLQDIYDHAELSEFYDWVLDEYVGFLENMINSNVKIQFEDQCSVFGTANQTGKHTKLVKIVFTPCPNPPGDLILSSFSLIPNTFNKSHNGAVSFNYSLTSSGLVGQFKRRIKRLSDGQYINPDTGQQGLEWYNWSVLTTSGTVAPYNYSYNGVLNPYYSYANWTPGLYTLSAQAYDANGNPSNIVSTSFTITEDVNPPFTLSNFSLTPNTFNKSYNGSVSFYYSLRASRLAGQFQRRIIRISDGQYINPNTGQQGSEWYNWTVLSTTGTVAPYNYSYNGVLNPYYSYANWTPGLYTLSARAYDANGNPSNIVSVTFTITEDVNLPFTLSAFSLSPNSFDKSYNGAVSFTYSLTASRLSGQFQRRITRISDGKCINPNTGDPGSCWYNWTVLSTTGTFAPYIYSYTGVLNPYYSYANWEPGLYTLEARAYDTNGNLSNNIETITFTITD